VSAADVHLYSRPSGTVDMVVNDSPLRRQEFTEPSRNMGVELWRPSAPAFGQAQHGGAGRLGLPPSVSDSRLCPFGSGNDARVTAAPTEVWRKIAVHLGNVVGNS
jgi:hypothetical protein